MDKERTMLIGVGLAQEFSEEAVDTAKYLVNMYHSLVLVNMTPCEVWFVNNQSLSHLKVFVCDAFVHFPKEKRSKLEKEEIKCISIGYKEGMKGYKLWDIASRRTMYSRDVIFREVKGKYKSAVVQTKKNLEKVKSEQRNKVDNLDESIESDEEVEEPTSVVSIS
jgi:hypothetical protein